MSKFYFYTCFGLNIKSQIYFPELKSTQNNYDVIIRFDEEKNFPNASYKKNSNIVKYSSNDISFIFDNKPLFRVKKGKQIIVNSNIYISDVLLRSLILGQGMGILLHQMGYLVLHGSAVNMGNNAIAFIGSSGEGKSTIVAALSTKGYPVITDDILVVDFDKNNNPVLLSSFPRIKLWEDVLNLLKKKKNLYPKIDPQFKKYSYILDKKFCEQTLPLKNIYVLGRDKKNIVIPIKSQEALIELIKNSYLIFLFDEYEKEQNLIQCGKIVTNISLKHLKRSQSLESIGELVRIVEKDVLII